MVGLHDDIRATWLCVFLYSMYMRTVPVNVSARAKEHYGYASLGEKACI